MSATGRNPRVKVDPAVQCYDPAANNYDLDKDPRCLFGWGPPSCACMLGHSCFRELGHPGRCDDGVEWDQPMCGKWQRPRNWDAHGRKEANQ